MTAREAQPLDMMHDALHRLSWQRSAFALTVFSMVVCLVWMGRGHRADAPAAPASVPRAAPSPGPPRFPRLSSGRLALELDPKTGKRAGSVAGAATLRPELEWIELSRSAGDARDTFELALGAGDQAKARRHVDLGALVARVPRWLEGHPELVRISLAQQELNRRQTQDLLVAGQELWLANNSLRCGLWEVGLREFSRERRGEANAARMGSAGDTLHAWFRLPKAFYAKLFDEMHGDGAWLRHRDALRGYPELDGRPVPLAAFRQLSGTRHVEFGDKALRRLPRLAEHRAKRHLLLQGPTLARGGICEGKVDAVEFARLVEPGRYSTDETLVSDLRWLCAPEQAAFAHAHRRSELGQSVWAQPFAEVRVSFAQGWQLVVAHERLAELAPLASAPRHHDDLLFIPFGLGTPPIAATQSARRQAWDRDLLQYALVLDGSGRLRDNHRIGVDGVYVWAERGDGSARNAAEKDRDNTRRDSAVFGGKRLHVLVVSYGRITGLVEWVLMLD